MVHNKTSYSPK